MCVKLSQNDKDYCNGCEFHCVLGTQWKLFSIPAKYYPTINCRKITEYTDENNITTKISAKKREYAHQMARAIAAKCGYNTNKR